MQANSVDPNKTSDLDLHCLPRSPKRCTIWTINEPAHEIMALFVLRKLIFQTRMRSHPVELNV